MLSTTKLQGIGSKVGGSRHVSPPIPGQHHRKREGSLPKCLNQHNLNPFTHSLDVFGCVYNLLPLLPDMRTPSPKHANDWSLLARPPMLSPRLSDFHSVQGLLPLCPLRIVWPTHLCWPRTFVVLKSKVSHPRKPLNPRQTRMVDPPI